MSFEFYKSRSVSEVFVDSLQFTKQHYRLVLRPVLILVVIYGFLSALTHIFSVGSTLNLFVSGDSLFQDSFLITFIVAMIAGAFSFPLIAVAMLTGLLVVKHVYENKLQVEIDFNYQFRKFLLGYIGLSILYSLASFVGFIFLIIPGFYFFIALYPSYGAYLIEKKGVVESLKRGHDLSKKSWWFIAGSLLLMYILMLGIDLIAGLPVTIISFLVGAGMDPAALVSQEEFSLTFLILVLISTVGSMASFLIYVIFGIQAGILYFTLRERKEGNSIADELKEFESELSDKGFSSSSTDDDSFKDTNPESNPNNQNWR